MLFGLYFFFFLTNGPLEGTLPLMVATYGFKESHYGVFLSVVSATFIATPTVVAYVTDKNNPYAISIIGMLLGFIGALVIGLGIFKSFVVFFFAYILLLSREIFNFSIGSQISVSIAEKERSKFFSIRDLFLYGSIAIGQFAGSLVTRKLGGFVFYSVFSFLFILSCVFVRYIKRHNIITKKGEVVESADEMQPGSDSKSDKRAKVRRLLRKKTFISFFVIEVLTSVYGAAMRFVPMLGLSLGIDVADFMTLIGIVTLINALGGLVLGYLVDVKRKKAYVIDLAIDVVPAMVFAITNNIALFTVTYILVLLKDMLSPISFAYFFDCFDKEDAPLALGVLSSIGNAASIAMPLIVGFLWEQSRSAVFLLSTIAIAIAATVAWLFLPARPVKASELTL